MKNIKFILAYTVLSVLLGCSPEDKPEIPIICVMHQIAQESTIDTSNGGTIENANWNQMNTNDADKFYSNVCSDDGKITYSNSIRFTKNGNPNWLYLRRNIIVKNKTK